jgi:hypothetical protein
MYEIGRVDNLSTWKYIILIYIDIFRGLIATQ